MADFKITKKIDNFNNLLKALDVLGAQDVLIGIPESKSSRRGETLNNAELAYIQSKGSPIHRIPPRAFLEPSIKANSDKLADQQAQIIKNALNGQPNIGALDRLGLMGQNFAKGWFTDPRNGWPPNAPYTIQMKGSDRPLIDTSQMRNAITYVVRRK